MFSIGDLSRRTGVKVPTIRYYEGMGLLTPVTRSDGNQRRYDKRGLDRLGFIRHARDLGFPLEAIQALMALQDHPDRSCKEATDIAVGQLDKVRRKISQLQALERELTRIAGACDGGGAAGDCHVLVCLADHANCEAEHLRVS